MTSPPTFTKGVGRLATDRYDFESHITGTNFRHTADQTDVLHPSLVYGAATTVEAALEALNGFINGSEANGQGFISLGGPAYNCYHNNITTPNAPYDSSIPSINALFTDLFTNPNNPGYQRLFNGAIILIPSGTYKITSTINIPPGTIIMGEGFGTQLVNQTSPAAPMFQIMSDHSKPYGSTTDNVIDPGSDPTANKFLATRQTKFYNLIIADNFPEPKFLGDASYKAPQNITSSTPLVSVQAGANFICQNITFLGRVAYTGGVVSAVTSFAIQTNNSVPLPGTSISLDNCFIDGMAVPINTNTQSGNLDFVDITNCYIRAYGLLAGDSVDLSNNCFFHLSGTNINIQNNYLLDGYNNAIGTDNITSLVYINTLASGSPPAAQSYSNIIVSNNNVALNRPNNSFNSGFDFINFDASIIASVPTYISAISSNNNYQNTFEWWINGNVNANPSFSITNELVQTVTPQIILTSQGGGIVVTGPVTGNANNNDPLSFGFISLALTGSGTKTLTPPQYNNQIIKFTGSTTGNFTIKLPAVSGYSKLIDNSTTPSESYYKLIVETTSAAGSVIVLPGQKAWVYSDGTNIISVESSYRVNPIGSYKSSGSYGATLNTYTYPFSETASAITLTINNTQAGDQLFINGMMTVGKDGGLTASIKYILSIVDGSGTYEPIETAFVSGANGPTAVPICTTYSVLGSGIFNTTITVNVSVVAFSGGSGNAYVYNPSTLVVTHYRATG